MTRVYKIVDRAIWAAAFRDGVFHGAEIDQEDGYIHLSTAAQAGETAHRHFAGRHDLVLLALESEGLGEALRWEPSRGGALFPHLYAPLDPAGVVETRPLSLNRDGWPDPGELQP